MAQTRTGTVCPVCSKSIPDTTCLGLPGRTAAPEVDMPVTTPVGRFERQSVLAVPDGSCLGMTGKSSEELKRPEAVGFPRTSHETWEAREGGRVVGRSSPRAWFFPAPLGSVRGFGCLLDHLGRVTVGRICDPQTFSGSARL